MIAYIVAGAAAVDAFAVGVWVGKKWGNKIDASHIAAIGASVAKEVTSLQAGATKAQATVAAVEAKVAPVVAQVAPVVSQVEASAPVIAEDLQAKIQAAIAAATAGK